MKKTIFILVLLLSYCSLFSQVYLPCLQESEYQSNWQCIGPFNYENELGNQHFGAITAISVNPTDSNEIYIGASTAGLFYTHDRGKNWNCLTDNFPYPILGVSDIIIDYKVSPHKIMLATGSSSMMYDASNVSILISKDGGKNWTKHFNEDPNSFSSMKVKKITFDEINNIYYAFGNTKIIKSFDDGENWEIIFDANSKYLVDAEFEITSFVLGNENNSLFFATRRFNNIIENENTKAESELIEIENVAKKNQSLNFVNHTNFLKEVYMPENAKTTYMLKVSENKSTPNFIFVDKTYQETREHTIYYYNTKTNEITHVISPNRNNFPEDGFWFDGLQSNPLNDSILYYGGTVFYSSKDSGKSFSAKYTYDYGNNNIPHADIRSYLVSKYSADGENDEIYLGTDGGLSYSNNGGKSFRNLNGKILPITQFYGLGISPFTSSISAGSQDNSIFTYHPQTKKWIFTVRGDGYDVEYNKRIKYEAYGQYNSRVLYKTTHDEAPFSEFVLINSFEQASNKKTLATDNLGNLYFAEKKFHILRRGEKKWEEYSLPIEHSALAFAVSETDSNTIFLSNFWSGLYKSTDGGKTFDNITNSIKIGDTYLGNTRIHGICISPYDKNKVWISLGYLGNYIEACNPSSRVLFSNNGGMTWMDYSDGLPVYAVNDFAFLEGTQEALFAVNFEGVFFRESAFSKWKLFSTNLPKVTINEIKIDYCRAKLVAATFGRSIWETDLPRCKYNEPYIIKKKKTFSVEDIKKEALYFTRDIIIKKKGKLIINCEVHMPKEKSIFAKNKNQIEFTENGKIVNECGETWGGIIIK